MKTPKKMNLRQKGRAFQSGRKLRVKRGEFSEGYRTRLAVDPRRARRVLRKSGFRVNPSASELNLDSPVYQERVRVPKWNVKVSPLMDADVGGRLLRQRLPHFSKADHESAARYHQNERKRWRGAWDALIDKEHRRVFGRPFEATDYKISGIGREEYSESAKDRLRSYAHAASNAGAAAAAHWRAAGRRKRMKENPANPARSRHEIVTITGKRSGRILGYATPETSRAELGRAALMLANAHLEPVKIERVKVRTRGTPKSMPAPVRAYLKLAEEHEYDIARKRNLESKLFGTKKNPTTRNEHVTAAARRFSRFTGHRADRVRMIPYPKNPGAGLSVGPVLAIGYTATRDGKTQNYLHKFAKDAAPTLISSHDGRQLILSGGRYKFTERGIVDARKRTT